MSVQPPLDESNSIFDIQKQLEILTGFAEEGFYSCHIMPDRTVVFNWATPRFLQLIGYSLTDLNTLGGFSRLVHPDEQARVEAAFQQTIDGIMTHLTFRIITSTERECLVDHRLHLIPTESAEYLKQLVGVVREITSEQAPEHLLSERLAAEIRERKRGEAALLASEDRKQAILAAIPDMMFLMSRDGETLDCYPGMYGDFLPPNEEFIGKNVNALFPEEVSARLITAYRETVDQQITQELEIKLPVGKHRVNVFDVRVVPVSGQRAMSIVRDVTARYQTEELLRVGEERNRAFLCALPDAITVTDPNGVCLEYHPGNPHSNFLPVGDVLGKNLRDLLPPEILRLIGPARDQALATCEPQTLSVPFIIDQVQRYFEVRLVLIEEGNLLSIARDITDSVIAEQALRTSEEQNRVAEAKYRNLIEQIPAAVYVDLIKNGRMEQALYISPYIEKILGYRPEAFFGDPTVWERLIHPADADEALTIYRKHYRDHEPIQHEYRMIAQDGRTIWVRDESKMIGDSPAGGVYSQGLLTDITTRKEFEAELRAAEAKYRNLVEQIPAAIYIDHVVDGKLNATTYISPFVEQILGRSPKEIQEDVTLWTRLVHPDDKQQVLRHFSEHYQAKIPLNIEYRMLTRHGHEVWIRNEAIVLWSEADGAFYSQGLVHDISERKRVEQMLRLQNARLKAQLDAAPDGILTVDNNRRWIGFNRRFLEIFNLPEDVTTSGDSMTALEHARAIVADADEFIRVTNQCYQDKLASTHDEVQFKDGRIFDRRSSPVVDPETGVLGRLWVYREMTQAKRSEELLRAAEAEYRALFDNMPLGIYRSSPEGRQLRANPALARLNGYDSEEDQLQGVNDIGTEWYVDPSRRDEFKKQLDLNGVVHNFESEIYRHKTRERIWISEDAIAIHRKDGKLLYYEGTVQDITARKEAEQAIHRLNQELQNALRLKDEFLANMSHEFRTPLTVILTSCESMVSGRYGAVNEQQIITLQRVQKQGRHLLDMVNNLLDMAALASGSIGIQKGRVLLSDLCEHSIYAVKEAAEKKKLILSYTPDPNVKTMIADERRVGQIVQSLLNNAIKFTPEGGKVGLEVRGDAQRGVVDIIVWDTGMGVSQDDQQRLFQPFIQLDTTLSRRNDGAGLGLALAYHLAQLHGGTISLASDAELGTRFTVTLPWSPNQ